MTETCKINDIAGGRLTPEFLATMLFATGRGEIGLGMNDKTLANMG